MKLLSQTEMGEDDFMFLLDLSMFGWEYSIYLYYQFSGDEYINRFRKGIF